MKKIIILEIDENGDVSIMSKDNIGLDGTILDEIVNVYKKLNITEKNKNTNRDYSGIYKYDYSKKSSLDVNSYANV